MEVGRWCSRGQGDGEADVGAQCLDASMEVCNSSSSSHRIREANGILVLPYTGTILVIHHGHAREKYQTWK